MTRATRREVPVAGVVLAAPPALLALKTGGGRSVVRGHRALAATFDEDLTRVRGLALE
jgi:hypothetical protein